MKCNMSNLLLLREEVNTFANSKTWSLVLTPNLRTLYQAQPPSWFPVCYLQQESQHIKFSHLCYNLLLLSCSNQSTR